MALDARVVARARTGLVRAVEARQSLGQPASGKCSSARGRHGWIEM